MERSGRATGRDSVWVPRSDLEEIRGADVEKVKSGRG